MNKLMTTIATAASLAIWSLSATSTSAGEVLDRVLSTKTLTVAVGTDWGKMSYLDDKHELAGSDIDLAKAVADRLGVEIKFVTPGWDVITAGKWEGRWDLSLGQMTPTKARGEKFSFPAIYFFSPGSAAVHSDSNSTELSDLNDKTIGVFASSTFEEYANGTFQPEWIGAKPIEYAFKAGEVKAYASGNINPLDDLRLGDGLRLDAVLWDTLKLQKAIEDGYPLKILPGKLFTAPASIAVLHGDKEFSDKIAEVVDSMRADGALSELTIKWYGADYSVE
ncbi:transporter substrate-binding domain-containing protein [Sinorhizobium meliloti]|nr:transporter substrate-binding domain-containing protein [Sinorhizobium meliloti]